MHSRTRRYVGQTAWLIGAWTVASFVSAGLVQPSPELVAEFRSEGLPEVDGVLWALGRALVGGVLAGVASSVLEVSVFAPRARRIGVRRMLVLRTLVYAVLVSIVFFFVARFVARFQLGIPFERLLDSVAFRDFLSTQGMAMIGMLVLASFIIAALTQVARMLGPAALSSALLGRYETPEVERRIFMFVDLASSTSIAESLGPVRFAAFKDDFFHDLAEPLLDARGHIVQYVGDEVMMTWPWRAGAGSAVECVFDLDARLARRRAEYERRYGVVPVFRAGIHGGEVVVSQLGDVKRELVFSGDPVNTAARILELTKALEAPVLASAEVLAGAVLPDGVEATVRGEHLLRGRSSETTLVALSRRADVLPKFGS